MGTRPFHIIETDIKDSSTMVRIWMTIAGVEFSGISIVVVKR
jgi:hypothetical protein